MSAGRSRGKQNQNRGDCSSLISVNNLQSCNFSCTSSNNINSKSAAMALQTRQLKSKTIPSWPANFIAN